MDINNSEINGFLIDQFNQYDLEVGKAQGTCPLCSSSRKDKNKKAQCASYDWSRGLGTCHNCNETFQLHTFQRKGASEKVYIKPEWKNKTTLSNNAIKWFEKRGISHGKIGYPKMGRRIRVGLSVIYISKIKPNG